MAPLGVCLCLTIVLLLLLWSSGNKEKQTPLYHCHTFLSISILLLGLHFVPFAPYYHFVSSSFLFSFCFMHRWSLFSLKTLPNNSWIHVGFIISQAMINATKYLVFVDFPFSVNSTLFSFQIGFDFAFGVSVLMLQVTK